MIKEYFLMSIKNITYRRMRSWLTVLGIFIGITAIVALISLGQGMQITISQLFQNLGADKIMISAGGGGPMGLASSPLTAELASAKLYEHDADVVKRVRGVEHAAGLLIKTAKVKFNDKTKYVIVYGVPTDSKTKSIIEEIDFFMIERGRQLDAADRYGVDIGYSAAYDVFGEEIKLGDKISIEGNTFKVAGIQKKSGSPIHDGMLRINLETARDIFDEPKEVSSIFAKVQDGFASMQVADSIEDAMRKDRDVEKGKEDFTVRSSEQIISGVGMITNMIFAVVIGIASISLLVGGIGIMNTMYTSVLERTREIGIMKAIGARNSDIMLIFLIESGLLGLVGGAIGIVLGIGVAKVVEVAAFSFGIEAFKAAITFELIIGSLLFSFLIGSVSGLLPAREAAHLNPIQSLRYE